MHDGAQEEAAITGTAIAGSQNCSSRVDRIRTGNPGFAKRPQNLESPAPSPDDWHSFDARCPSRAHGLPGGQDSPKKRIRVAGGRSQIQHARSAGPKESMIHTIG